MRQTFTLAFAICSLVSFATYARADEAPLKGPAPSMARAKLAESGELTLVHADMVPEQFTETQKVTVTEFRTEIIGGRSVAKPAEVVKEVMVVKTRFVEKELSKQVAKDKFHVIDVEGQRIEGDVLAKSLASEKPVLFTYNKKALDPFYAAFFKPGTLVVYLHEAAPEPARLTPAPGAIRAEAIPLRGVIRRAIPVPIEAEAVPEAPPK